MKLSLKEKNGKESGKNRRNKRISVDNAVGGEAVVDSLHM
jgi:hypothetical protein